REIERRLDPLLRLRDGDVGADEVVQQLARLRALRVLRVRGKRRHGLRLDRDVGQRLRERVLRGRVLVLRAAAARERGGRRDQDDGGAVQPAACTTIWTAPSVPRRSVFSTRS